MATQDISQLVVEVQSKGIQTAANQLDKLAAASDKAEAAVKKLGSVIVTTQSSTATAQAQADASGANSATASAQKLVAIAQKRDVDLYRIRSAEADRLRSLQEKRDVEEWQSATAQAALLSGIQQKRDTEIYESRVSEAARIKAIQEKRDTEEYTSAQDQVARMRAIEEKRDIELYTLRVDQQAKMKATQEKRDMEEFTSAQSEAARIKTLEEKRDTELYEIRVAANAKIAAEEEKQRRLNAAFQTSSIASQIRTATQAQAYGAMGGNAEAQFGSEAATANINALTAAQERLAAATAAARLEQQGENAALAEAHALARGLSGSMGALWVTYGNLLGMGVGIALGASLKGVITVGKDVENTLESIRVLGGATTKEIEDMSSAITTLGQGVQGPKDVAEALQVLTMAGLSAEDAMKGVQAALSLAVAGGVSVEKSSETLVQVGTALGYTAEGFDHVGDVIAKTAAASMSSVDSISSAFKSAAAVGEVYGASLNDIAIGLAAVANLGIQGTSAGTALKNMYKDLSASTQKVTGTLADMHMKITDFRDADGFMLPLVDVIGKLNAGLGTLTGQARNMAMVKLFGQQGVREGAELLKMINTASKEIDPQASEKAGKAVLYANKLVELQAQIQQADAFATQAAIAMAQTTSNQLKSVGNTLETTFIGVFKNIEPQISEVARAMKSAFSSEEFKEGLTTVITAIADLTKFVVEHAKAVGVLVAAWAGWNIVETVAGLSKMALAMDAAGIAAKGFSLSLGPIAIAIAALGAAWVIYKANKDSAMDDNSATHNLQDYINNTVKAATREAEILEMRKKGASEADIIRKQQIDADQDASAQAVKQADKELAVKRKYVADMKAVMDPTQLAIANEAESKGMMTTQFDDINKYLNAVHALTSAEQVHAAQVKIVTGAESTLAGLRKKNADAQTQAARDALKNRPTGDGELSTKANTKGVNDAYNAAIKAQEDIMKAASQQLSQFRETEQTKFKSGQIGQMQVINETADAEIAAYQKIAAAARAAEAKANGTPNKTADAERFHAEAQRADASAAQAEKMRLDSTVAAQKTAETTITNLKVKSLEEQGKYVDAANLKWSADGKVALQQAQDDLEKYGDQFPWLSNLVQAYGQVRDDTMNSAQLKQDTIGFGAALAEVEETLKGVKSASFGGSIGTVMDSATAATEKFDVALEKAKAKRNDLWVDALVTGAPQAIKQYEEANKEISAITDKQKTMWQDVADTITNSLTQAFGKSGKALGELNKSFIEYDQSQNASAEDRMKQYGDMAQAASGFFDSQSKGYKLLNGIAQVFHVAEMARTLMRTVAYVATGAANMFAQGGFGGFAGVAAMAAVMAAVGYTMAGSSGGADPKMDAAYVQQNQGTGTVFGDVGTKNSDGTTTYSQKSDSISKSLDDLKNNSDATLPLTQQMVSSLQNIESGMSGLANFAIRSGATNGSNFNVQTGTLGSTGSSLVGSAIGGATGAALGSSISLVGDIFGPVGAVVGAAVGALVSKFWGKTTQDITDSGLQFGGKVSNLEQGQGFDQYANVKTTTSSWFGLSKSSSDNMLTQGVDSQLSQQFGLVFSGLEDALKGAAGSLGTTSDAVGKAVDNVVIQTTKISLKGLSGDDLTNAINNVMSAAMDQIAEAVYPQMQDFEQVGEGYAQTVIRVASGVEQADVALKQLGVTAINYTQIQNKQGDVALELARQSILAQEGLTGIGQLLENMTGTVTDLVAAYKALDAIRTQMNAMGMNGSNLGVDMVSGAGGVSQLQSALSSYQDKYFTDQEKAAIMLKTVSAEFDKLGVALPATRSALRDLIDQTTTSNPYLAGQLVVLAGDYDTYATAVETASSAQTSALSDTIDSLNQFKASLKSLRDSLTLSDSSILTPTEKLIEAQQQYQDTIAKAQTGDTTAQGNVSSAAQAYLDASRTVNASSQAYTDTYNQVMSDLGTLGSSTDDQLTNAEQQLQVLQDQANSLDQLNTTADAIRTGFDSLQIRPVDVTASSTVTVDTSALEAQVADLTQQLADAQASTDQKLDTLAAVVYDSQSQSADQISSAVTTSAQQSDWVATTRSTLTQQR